MSRIPRILLAVWVVLLFSVAPASASDWLVVKVSSKAFFALDSKTWRPLSARMRIPARSWITTGKRGRVMLRRNNDTIIIQPNSLTGISGSRKSASRTFIKHELGQVVLNINKGKRERVRVRTRHLTAVVKGTKFSVTTNSKLSTVSVDKGLVAVSDNASGESSGVGAGQSASSSGTGGLSASGTSSSSGSASAGAAGMGGGAGDGGNGDGTGGSAGGDSGGDGGGD